MTEEGGEPKVCQICSDFEPQAWRKSLCRNCFHTLEEHSEDLLAAQAESAPKEKAEGSSPKPKEESKKGDDVRSDKSKTAKTPTSPVGSVANAKDKKPVGASPTTSKAPSSKSSTAPSASSSPSSSNKSSSKFSSSSSSSSTSTSSSSQSTTSKSSPTSSSTSSTSSSSSSSSSTTTSSPSSSKSTKTSTSSSSSSSSSQVPMVSKAKSLTSKFENAASKDTTPKSAGKLEKPKGSLDTNKTSKFGDPKGSKAEESKKPQTKSSSSPKDSKEESGKKESSPKTTGKDDETKNKSTPSRLKTEEKDSKSSETLKSKNAAPFGKGMLRSTKDKEKDTVEKRAEKNAKDVSTNEVKSKLSSFGDKSSKFDSLDRKDKTENGKSKIEDEKSRENGTSNTSGSGTGSSVKIGQSEKTGARCVEEKATGQQNATKHAREIDKPGPGKVNTDSWKDTAKPSWQVRGKDGTGTEAKKREDRTKDEKEGEKGTAKRGQVSGDAVGGKRETTSSEDKDRPLQKEKRSDVTNVKDGQDAKPDGIHGAGHSTGTSTSTARTTTSSSAAAATNRSGGKLTTAPSSPTKTSGSCVASSSSSAAASTTTTSSATGTKASTSSSDSLSKFLPSLSLRRTSKDGPGNDVPKVKASPKDDGPATPVPDPNVEKLSKELKVKDEKVAKLEGQLQKMEEKLKSMEKEKDAAKKMADKSDKEELEKSLQALRSQLSEMQGQCAKLATDNSSLMGKLQEQEKVVKECQDVGGKTTENELLERDLELTEKELDEVKDENLELQREIMEMKNEMDEMYDTFRENEQDEFRELQKELDMTAKNCRILQFKLRKAERRNEQIEEDRMHYEEKLRHLQDQFDSQDAKNHIRVLEEELRIAKEVSVRLHDELDIVEDKRLKAQEDNKHLTELLEHTDKRQFRMEMEIDKLRDLVCDLRQQLKEAKNSPGNHSTPANNRNSTSPEKTTTPAVIERQASRENQEYDVSQLMRDLCDTMERENDLKDQLKFTEEEAKTLRRRVSDMDEENESLRLQLQKMSEKASKHKKKEQERIKELEEERKVSEAAKAALAAQSQQEHHASSEFTLVLGAGPNDDVITIDEPIPVSQRKDSTDEDLMNVMQLRVQLEMLEQELMTSHKKMDDMDLENENLMEEVKFLQERLGEYEKSSQESSARREPGQSDAYYEDRLKEMGQENDVLRWKLIEKEREMERMNLVQSRHNSRDSGHTKRSDKLKKSKSLDTDHDPVVSDLRKQLDHAQTELIKARQRADEAEEKNEELTAQENKNVASPTAPPLPGICADDAAVENVELRDRLRHLEAEVRDKADTIKGLTENLQRLTRDPSHYHSVATSPTTGGNPNIPGIPPLLPGTKTARVNPQATNQLAASGSRDSKTQSTLRQADDKAPHQKTKMAAAQHLEELRGEADGASTIHVHFAAEPVITLATDAAGSADGGSREAPGQVKREGEKEDRLPLSEQQSSPSEHGRSPCSANGEISLSPRRNAKGEDRQRVNESESSSTVLSKSDDHNNGFDNYNINKPSSSARAREDEEGPFNNDNAELLTLEAPNKALEATTEENIFFTKQSTTSANQEKSPLRERLQKSFRLDIPDTGTECEEGEDVKMASKTENVKDKQKRSDDSKKSEDGGASGGGGGSESKSTPKSDEYKSIMLKYPGGKSQVVTTGEESRVELMEKVLDMDDEISELLSMIRRREDDYNRMCREVKALRSQMEELRDESRRNELDLLQELDMLHDKNTVMSNLLDIINERAEAAEEELEKRIQEGRTTSPPRSASNVSQVSALSDTSMGSDEVFLNAHGNREGVVNRDWEAKLKGRIESLERLLAEERQKVMMAEKKLAMAANETVQPSVTDDVKLRLREKELLQEELIESQRHLHIAADQIQGLKERFQILDEEHNRLKEDYGKLYNEVEKPTDEDGGDGDPTSPISDSSNKTPVNALEEEDPFVSKRISVIEAPNFKALKQASTNEEIQTLKTELAEYKQKTQDLEYKIEEINDIWRSKSLASERDRDDLELQVGAKTQEITLLQDTMKTLEKDLCEKVKQIAKYEIELEDKNNDLSRKSEQAKEQENEKKRVEDMKQMLESQISQRDGTIRGLNETIRIRDERLKEKDDILFKLRCGHDEAKSHVKNYEGKIRDLTVQVNDKNAVIAVLKDQISSAKESSQSHQAKEITCSGDAEAELKGLREETEKLRGELDKKEKERLVLKTSLEQTTKTMSDSLVLWRSEKSKLQRDLNVSEEKVRLYEVYSTQSQGEALESLKEESYSFFSQKEALTCELESLKVEVEAAERTHRNQTARLQAELNDKLKQLKSEVESNTKLRLEAERLGVQAEKAYHLQQEMRVLRAEHLAMKVRYESRLDKMGNECNRMVTTIEKLQRQHQADQELMEGFQKNMALLTERYTDQLLKSEDDQGIMTCQMNEIEELRAHLEEVMKIVRELREKSLDQERLRSELVNRLATDKSRWEMDRANLVSQVNQLEEQLSSTSRQTNRSRDIQVNLSISWEKERKEQKRLLAEAHTLALDLQDQLRSRDETSAHDRKELLRQMEGDRLAWTKEKREMERKIAQLDSANRKLGSLQKRVKDAQDTLQERSNQWRAEREELVTHLTESRDAHTKDCKRMEEVYAELIKLKELGSVLVSREKAGQPTAELDKNITDSVKESLQEISKAAEELGKQSSLSHLTPEAESRRLSLASNHSSKDTVDSWEDRNDVIIVPELSGPGNKSLPTDTLSSLHASSKPTKSGTQSSTSASSKPASLPLTTTTASAATTTATTVPMSGKDNQETTTPSKTEPDRITIKTSSKISEKIKTLSSKLSTEEAGKQSKTPETLSSRTPTISTQPPPVSMRHFDSINRRYDRPPSYTSGTRSAQSSRATTPEVDNLHPASYFEAKTAELSTGTSTSPSSSSYQSHTLPKHSTAVRTQQKKMSPSTSLLSPTAHVPKRPGTFVKSLSTDEGSSTRFESDSPKRLYSSSSQKSGGSTSSTPTHSAPSSVLTAHLSPSSFSSTPSLDAHLLLPDSDSSLSPSNIMSARNAKCSPRTARKRFFNETPSPSNAGENLSWPERRHSPSHVAQKRLPDASEVRKEAEVEHDLISKKPDAPTTLKYSISLDENFRQSSSQEQFSQEDESTSGVDCTTPDSAEILSDENSVAFSTIPENQAVNTSTLPRSGKSAKEKRKFFKKAGSLESPVGSSIAKAGVSAMPMAAPSGFTPSNFFAAVKGKLKLKPSSKQKSSEGKTKQQDARSPSPLFIPTEIPDIDISSGGSTLLPVPIPQRHFHDLEKDEDKHVIADSSPGRSRHQQRQVADSRDKGRSKSMDERRRPDSAHRHTGEVWRFNETHL